MTKRKIKSKTPFITFSLITLVLAIVGVVIMKLYGPDKVGITVGSIGISYLGIFMGASVIAIAGAKVFMYSFTYPKPNPAYAIIIGALTIIVLLALQFLTLMLMTI